MHVRRIQLADVELSVAEAGVGGRPLLLLHGFTGAKEDFSGWLDRLAELGWHAVAPDHRGHGESAKPPGIDAYSMSILTGDGMALVEALGWDRYAVLGHSMGGFVAQRMACEDPSRLTGLVLMDTSHGPVEGIGLEEVGMATKIATEDGMDALADLLASIQSPLDTPAHRRVLEERPEYAQFEDRKLRATSPSLYASLGRELVTCSDLLDSLSAMHPQPPALVLVGEQDLRFVGPAKRMAEVLPKATLAVIPDAGHSPQFENPPGWWEAVSSFLESIE